jgi:hypothetical protein
MRVSEFSNDISNLRLDEMLPGLAAKAVGSLANGVVSGTGVGGALAKAGAAVGMVPSPTDLADLADAAADPLAVAKAYKDANTLKKQLQDQIKQTEASLKDLRAQLAAVPSA